MACLNCTARVLRLFIHDAAALRIRTAPIAHTHLLPRRFSHVQRRHSSFVAAAEQLRVATPDDEYLPFIDLDAATAAELRPPPLPTAGAPPEAPVKYSASTPPPSPSTASSATPR